VKNVQLILLLLSAGLAVAAQTVKRPVSIDTKVHSGLNLPFYDALNYLMKDDVYAFDIAISFPAYGKDFWENLYRYPRSGFGGSYWSLGNDEVLGKAYAIYGFLNIPLFMRSEKFSINYQGSVGGAWLTKKFDVYTNHLNRAIGSHLNLFIWLGVDGRIRLLPRCDLEIDVGITHFSNGKTRSPNYGINAGSLSLGLNYLFNNNGITRQEPEIPGIAKRYIQSVIYSAGMKVYDNLNGRRYFISSVTYNLEYMINHKRRIGLGPDFFYDGSISEALASTDGTPDKYYFNHVRLGLHASYTSRYKQLLMGIQLGHYIYSKYTDLTLVYSRISLHYLITDHLIAGMAIKSHYAKADNIEWGIGYCW
jgi:hypothetical protein